MIVISGCPGSGKSTLAAKLAARSARGLHLKTDAFFRFPAHRLDPSTSGAGEQNAAIQRAYLASALSFRNDGYDVVIDGVITSTAILIFEQTLGPCRWLTLHVSLDSALERCAARGDQPSAHPELVRHMHAQFERDSAAAGGQDSQWLNTTSLTPEQVLRLASERLAPD